MLRAAVYARYSSALQRETSVEDQVAVCRAAASRFGCTILQEHIYLDRELSGAAADRPGYTKLLAAARERAFDAILVEDVDRLTRDQATLHRDLKRCRFWGIQVFSVSTGAVLTSKAGRLLASVMGWRSEEFLENLADKTRRGLAGQARCGYSAGGRTFGYRTEPIVDPAQIDPHGQPLVTGYRRTIIEEQAAVVRRIFAHYADGWAPRKIAHGLNQESVPPPRSHSWSYTAIYGTPRLGTGLLRNRLYIGEVTWNRFRWEKDPETGKRVPRVRASEEWIVRQDESLRIVPQELWERVQRRLSASASASVQRAHPGGPRSRYLFSGLLVCGGCGARYVMRGRSTYACSFHVNRGASVCRNSRSVNRQRLETRLLRALREEIFTPEAIASMTRKVNEQLRDWHKSRRRAPSKRTTLEGEVRQATAELANIQQAIRRGLLTDLTRQMLEEAEARVRVLQAEFERPVLPDAPAVQLLPTAIRQHIEDLERILSVDVDEARASLRQLLGEVVLRPTAHGLVADLRGNLQGLVSLSGEQALSGRGGSGGRI